MPVGDDPPPVEQDEPREEVRGESEIVEHGQDRRAVAGVEVADELHDLDLVSQVEMDGGFVEDQDRRVLGDGHRQEHELALAEGQLPGVAAEEMADTDPLDRRRNGGPVARPHAAHGMLVRQPPERDDLLHARGERQRRQLRDHGQAAGDRQAVETFDAVPGELDRPGRAARRAPR